MANNEGIAEDSPPSLRLSVIVPARNEAAVLGGCLESLLTQSEPGFALGAQWELIVIDDDSSDGTRAIAESAMASHEGTEVISPPALDLTERGGFTGKTNACWAGAQRARAHGCCSPMRIRCTSRETFPGPSTRRRSTTRRYSRTPRARL